MSQSRTYRVLLVEDNPIDAELALHAFADYGGGQFHVEHVSQLQAALARLSEGEVDFIVTDRSLPGMRMETGVALLRAHAPRTPIVVHTASTGDAERAEALRRGADAIYPKGDPAELVRAVTGFLLTPRDAAPDDFRPQLQARLRPAAARYYRMLDLEHWYPVVAEPDAYSLLLYVEGELRDVRAEHFETRTQLVL